MPRRKAPLPLGEGLGRGPGEATAAPLDAPAQLGFPCPKPPMPDSIALGPLLLPTQALLLLIATAAALGVLSLLRDAEPPLRARAEARLFIALVLGLLGARIGWILRHWQAYADSPGALLAFRDGGYDPWIGLVVGAVAVLVMAVRQPGERRAEAAGTAEPHPVPPSMREEATLRPAAAARLNPWQRLLLIPAAAGLSVLLAGQILLGLHARAGATPLPSMQVLDLEGRPQRLPMGQGRPQVINLWASWCAPCRREMPAFARVQALRSDVDFVYLNIGESPAEIAAFTRTLALPLAPIWRDPAGSVPERLQVRGYPTTLIVDGEGRLLHRRSGELSEASLKALLPPRR